MRDDVHPSGSAGKTKGASVKSGLSDHSQINDSPESQGMGEGQGGRPKARPGESVSDNGKTFTIR